MYRLTFICGKAGKVEQGELLDKHNLCKGQTPRFGYYWWSWIPSFKYNSGNPLKRHILDFGMHWFCYWVAITAWPKRK